MEGVIYQIRDGELLEMREQPYDTEALLQDLLSSHPALLAGEQINPGSPRRWLLVQPEISVPDMLNGSSRWSLDHLFLDQDAIPTFVEVKRSTDTRIRREVIGQMLDYSAHATAYWPGERIRNEFEKRCHTLGLDPLLEVQRIYGEDIDAFWDKASENLQEGRLRLLFVADIIPKELRRVIEFLHAAFRDIEVLGVEVKQYRGGESQALVPRIVGQSVRVSDKKLTEKSTPGSVWTYERFVQDCLDRQLIVGKNVLDTILEFAEANKLYVTWGKGKKEGSIQVRRIKSEGALIELWSSDDFDLREGSLKEYSVCENENQFDELFGRFKEMVSDSNNFSKYRWRISIRDVSEGYQRILIEILETLFLSQAHTSKAEMNPE